QGGSAAVGLYPEDRNERGGYGPQRSSLATLPPARCVDVLDGLITGVDASLLDWRADGSTHDALGLTERPEGDLHAQHVTEEAAGFASTHLEDAGKQADEGDQARSAHSTRR